MGTNGDGHRKPLTCGYGTSADLGEPLECDWGIGVTRRPWGVWELSLGIWLVTKGFKPAAVAALTATHADAEHSPAWESTPLDPTAPCGQIGRDVERST